MHVPALLLLAFLTQSPTPVTVNGIQNGDFERIDPTGTISNTLVPADGGYWNGAESHTIVQSGNRFLRFPGPTPDFVFQKVGSANNQTSSVTADARVRVRNTTDEARLTLTSGDGVYRSLAWSFKSGATLDPVWSFYEQLGGGYATIPWTGGGQPQAYSALTGNLVSYNAVDVSASPLVVGFQAPQTGTVRVVVRPWVLNTSQQPVDLQHQLMFDTNDIFTAPAPTVLRTDTIFKNDGNGTVIEARVPVVQGQWIFLKLSQATFNATPVHVVYQPFFSYEGKRLTYRFGPALSAGNAPANPYVDVAVAANTWVNFTNLPIGAMFGVVHGVAPVAPLDIELSGRGDNTSNVDFDDVACRTTYDSQSLTALRNSILTEARWARDNHRLIRDRNVTGGPGQIGPVPTPYAVHNMNVVSGPSTFTSSIGREPIGLFDLLTRAYDDTDYEDWTWMREYERQLLSPVGLAYSKYDCSTDTYLTTSANYVLGVDSGADPALEFFQRTHDVTWLDRAYAGCQLIVANGVVTSDPTPPTAGSRIGLVAGGPFDIQTGAIILPPSGNKADLIVNREQITTPSVLVRAYVACKQFNAAHPAIVPARYPPASLNAWLSVADTAVKKAATMHNWVLPPSLGTAWGGSWQAFHGQFNDGYGYQGLAAKAAYVALDSLVTLSGAEVSLRNSLRDDVVLSGADYYIGMWEQGTARGVLNSGDQPRTWPQFLNLIQTQPTNPNRQRYGDQLLAAALHCQRFQYVNGIWTNGGLEMFHFLDLSGGFGGGLRAPESYLWGMSTALQVPWITQTQKDHIFAAVRQFQVTTIPVFKGPYGYYKSVANLGFDDPAGFEGRSIANFLAVLDVIDPTLPAAPTASAVPATLSPVPGSPAFFDFTITLPAPATQADLTTALNSRTKIALWSYVGGLWTRVDLWPALSGQFLAPTFNLPAGQVTIRYNRSFAAGAGKIKFTTRTWDTNGLWNQDTCYQEW